VGEEVGASALKFEGEWGKCSWHVHITCLHIWGTWLLVREMGAVMSSAVNW